MKRIQKSLIGRGIGCSMAIRKIHFINNDNNALAPITFFAFPPMHPQSTLFIDSQTLANNSKRQKREA